MNEVKKPLGRAMQKALAVICLLCLLLSLGAVTASAAGAAKITASSCTVERGDSASVAFNLEGNPGIWGIKLRIHYNHSALTLKSVTAGRVFEKSEFTMSENLNKDPYVIIASGNALVNKTANGAIVTLNFTVNSAAAYQSYPVSAEVSQVNNVKGEKISVSSSEGKVSVVACKHANKEWHVTKAAGCDYTGIETLTCKKCKATFETRTIKATGHKHTEIRNKVAATKTSTGYTGDTYCKDCGKLISKGKVIAKLKDNTPTTKPAATKPAATKPGATKPGAAKPATTSPVGSTVPTGSTEAVTNAEVLVFYKNSNIPLVFVSQADLSEFIRVEIDGRALGENDFSAESGSTIIKVSPDYMNNLSDGEHTISIVSTSGTVSSQFEVKTDSDSTNTGIDNAISDNSDNSDTPSFVMPIVIAVIVVVLIAGGAAAYFLIRKRRGM